ncbi:hypothetical protein SISNIDRAFT_484998 [Sistotremastrum niveocremeum HHB9708]|uniref:Glucose receptor Git3 N-terminal domain-containing protein n=1 Tax=Sistotremastrum niveocremeum HHB9708 TaxID=1314777 RepID=A0A164VD43_9AGAM|nr:hypothetical protein SISNIDRAFT_484998 [Sistotremastrum niveocremeum HHB9708]
MAFLHEEPSFGLSADTRGTFTSDVYIGLGLSIAAAILSGLAVFGLLCNILWQAFQNIFRSDGRDSARASHLQIFYVSLLFSHLLQSLGTLLNLVWLREAGVTEGGLCTTQAILRQTGQIGGALATLAITFSTWAIVIKGWRRCSTSLAAALVLAIWISALLLSPMQLAIRRESPFFGNTKYWCWIRPSDGLRDAIVFDMGWLWMAAIFEIILYFSAVVAIVSRCVLLGLGNLRQSTQRSVLTMAIFMIWYPVMYVTAVLPLSINRIWYFTRPQHEPPFAFTAASLVLFTLLGFFDVLLFIITRPKLVLRAGNGEDETAHPEKVAAFRRPKRNGAGIVDDLIPVPFVTTHTVPNADDVLDINWSSNCTPAADGKDNKPLYWEADTPFVIMT